MSTTFRLTLLVFVFLCITFCACENYNSRRKPRPPSTVHRPPIRKPQPPTTVYRPPLRTPATQPTTRRTTTTPRTIRTTTKVRTTTKWSMPVWDRVTEPPRTTKRTTTTQRTTTVKWRPVSDYVTRKHVNQTSSSIGSGRNQTIFHNDGRATWNKTTHLEHVGSPRNNVTGSSIIYGSNKNSTGNMTTGFGGNSLRNSSSPIFDNPGNVNYNHSSPIFYGSNKNTNGNMTTGFGGSNSRNSSSPIFDNHGKVNYNNSSPNFNNWIPSNNTKYKSETSRGTIFNTDVTISHKKNVTKQDNFTPLKPDHRYERYEKPKIYRPNQYESYEPYRGFGGYRNTYHYTYHFHSPYGYVPHYYPVDSGYDNTYRDILSGMLIWHTISDSSTTTSYRIYNYNYKPTTNTLPRKVYSDELIVCTSKISNMCPPNTICVCTKNQTILCVANVRTTVSCDGNIGAFCVISTISCIDEKDPACLYTTNNFVTIKIPCLRYITVVTVSKDYPQELQRIEYCVITIAEREVEAKIVKTELSCEETKGVQPCVPGVIPLAKTLGSMAVAGPPQIFVNSTSKATV